MKKINFFTLILLFRLITSCTQTEKTYKTHVIPEPNDMIVHVGRYEFSDDEVITYLTDENLDKEGYQLKVTKRGVIIVSATEIGKQYALATLMQLHETDGDINYIPLVTIKDQPRFKYRGLMLDESRHFFGIEFVKQTLEQMAFHKLNKFHWHLTDDQGWRIEIKKYPLLTEKGSIRKATQEGWQQDILKCPVDNKEYGGYYTQDQIKQVIAYATKLGIDIIPEIDMPGHMVAALHAYPELGEKDSYDVRQYWGVSKDVLDVSKPNTLQFAKDVITEICDLFPYKIIHIGGDEVPKKQWERSKSCQDLMKRLKLNDEEELQSWFLKEIEKVVHSKGKTLAGWCEILDGDMSKTATVYNWRFWTKENQLIKGATRGNEIVSCLNNRMYFDHYVSHDRDHFEPLAFPAVAPLHKMYCYNPIPKELDQKYHDKVIGVQGNLWTEYVTSTKIAQIRMYPRMALLGELGWTNQNLRDWENMNRKLPFMFKIYDEWKVKYNRVYISTDCDW